MGNQNRILAKEKTLIKLFESSVEKFPDNPMFWEKVSDKYNSASYKEMRTSVLSFSCGMISLGLKKGDKVAILDQARQDWITAELGILYAGAVNVPLSVKLESEELIFRLNHADVKMLVVSVYQYEKIKDNLNDLPGLQKVILLDGPQSLGKNEIGFDDVLELGADYFRENEALFTANVATIDENDCAMISYTSGTTSDPKGIMLSHKNLYSNCQQSLEMFQVGEDYRMLLILPLDHSFAHTAGMYVFIASGASLASVQLGKTPAATLKNVFTNINEIKPVALLSVPTLAKNLRKNIENGIQKKGKLTKSLFYLALKMAYGYNGKSFDKGKGFRIIYWPFYKILDKLVFRKIRESFGGKMKYFVGGGALLDIELQRFFLALGIPMYQGYGLTEASPVISSNTITHHKLGSSGKIVSDMKMKICNEDGEEVPNGEKGEIVVKGDNVMLGYYKNKTATDETLRNGWLYTGDLGYIDEDGFLYVMGRFKSLLIGDDGEKYSPEGIEEYVEENSEFIRQIMIYNNQKPYTSALLFPDAENLTKLLQRNKYSIHHKEAQEYIIQQIQKELKELYINNDQTKFPMRWLPSACLILSEGFTQENQMLNSTLKIVRGKIINHYESQIDSLYTAGGKSIVSPSNIEAIQKLLIKK